MLSRGMASFSGDEFEEMEKLNFARSVWGAEDALLSPPEYGAPLAYTFLSPPEQGGVPLAAAVESEESSEGSEDYISGLAEEIAQSMLQEDEEEVPMKGAPWGIGAPKAARSSKQAACSPTSPQSTLAGMGGNNWEVRRPGGVRNMGSSSPATPQEGEAGDVLYAELEDQRVKLAASQQQQMLSRQQQVIQRPSPLTPTNVLPPPPLDYRFLPNDTASPLPKTSRSPRYCKAGGQEENYPFRAGSKEVGAGWARGGGGPVVNRKSGGGGKAGGNGRRRAEESGKQQYHQFSLFASSNKNGNSIMMMHTTTTNNNNNNVVMINKKREEESSSMRAVFLGSPSASSRESGGGTGVFLPRRRPPGSTQDSRRKPDFSSWRHNPQVMRSRPKDEKSSCYFPKSHSTTLQEVAPNISLPSEWTY